MIKRETIILYIIVAAILLISGTAFVSAEDYQKYGIYVNDTKLGQDISVYVSDGFSYVPINKISKNLNIIIKDDKLSNAITITSGAKVIKITNRNLIEVNGVAQGKLDIPLILRDDNIYFPVLGLIDILGYQVETMNDISSIRIKSTNTAAPVGKLVDAELNKSIPVGKMDRLNYPKVAYLTFDDGLDSKVTPIILDILKEHDVKATFFIVGNTVEKNASLLKRMVKEGHSIGNHTYTHKKENIYSSAEGLKGEIERTSTVLYKTGGVITRMFRPPYGGPYIRKSEFQAVLSPYKTILWNIDSRDSSARNVSSSVILNNVINQVKNKRTAIIIMHDSGTHMETAKALPDIIKYLKDNGFAIEPITEGTNIYYEY